MAIENQVTPLAMPEALVRAIEAGHLTQEQLRELITVEASELGLTFDQALERARQGTLPHNELGIDIRMLVLSLAV